MEDFRFGVGDKHTFPTVVEVELIDSYKKTVANTNNRYNVPHISFLDRKNTNRRDISHMSKLQLEYKIEVFNQHVQELITFQEEIYISLLREKFFLPMEARVHRTYVQNHACINPEFLAKNFGYKDFQEMVKVYDQNQVSITNLGGYGIEGNLLTMNKISKNRNIEVLSHVAREIYKTSVIPIKSFFHKMENISQRLQILKAMLGSKTFFLSKIHAQALEESRFLLGLLQKYMVQFFNLLSNMYHRSHNAARDVEAEWYNLFFFADASIQGSDVRNINTSISALGDFYKKNKKAAKNLPLSIYDDENTFVAFLHTFSKKMYHYGLAKDSEILFEHYIFGSNTKVRWERNNGLNNESSYSKQIESDLLNHPTYKKLLRNVEKSEHKTLVAIRLNEVDSPTLESASKLFNITNVSDPEVIEIPKNPAPDFFTEHGVRKNVTLGSSKLRITPYLPPKSVYTSLFNDDITDVVGVDKDKSYEYYSFGTLWNPKTITNKSQTEIVFNKTKVTQKFLVYIVDSPYKQNQLEPTETKFRDVTYFNQLALQFEDDSTVSEGGDDDDENDDAKMRRFQLEHRRMTHIFGRDYPLSKSFSYLVGWGQSSLDIIRENPFYLFKVFMGSTNPLYYTRLVSAMLSQRFFGNNAWIKQFANMISYSTSSTALLIFQSMMGAAMVGTPILEGGSLIAMLPVLVPAIIGTVATTVSYFVAISAVLGVVGLFLGVFKSGIKTITKEAIQDFVWLLFTVCSRRPNSKEDPRGFEKYLDKKRFWVELLWSITNWIIETVTNFTTQLLSDDIVNKLSSWLSRMDLLGLFTQISSEIYKIVFPNISSNVQGGASITTPTGNATIPTEGGANITTPESGTGSGTPTSTINEPSIETETSIPTPQPEPQNYGLITNENTTPTNKTISDCLYPTVNSTYGVNEVIDLTPPTSGTGVTLIEPLSSLLDTLATTSREIQNFKEDIPRYSVTPGFVSNPTAGSGTSPVISFSSLLDTLITTSKKIENFKETLPRSSETPGFEYNPSAGNDTTSITQLSSLLDTLATTSKEIQNFKEDLPRSSVTPGFVYTPTAGSGTSPTIRLSSLLDTLITTSKKIENFKETLPRSPVTPGFVPRESTSVTYPTTPATTRYLEIGTGPPKINIKKLYQSNRGDISREVYQGRNYDHFAKTQEGKHFLESVDYYTKIDNIRTFGTGDTSSIDVENVIRITQDNRGDSTNSSTTGRMYVDVKKSIEQDIGGVHIPQPSSTNSSYNYAAAAQKANVNPKDINVMGKIDNLVNTTVKENVATQDKCANYILTWNSNLQKVIKDNNISVNFEDPTMWDKIANVWDYDNQNEMAEAFQQGLIDQGIPGTTRLIENVKDILGYESETGVINDLSLILCGWAGFELASAAAPLVTPLIGKLSANVAAASSFGYSAVNSIPDSVKTTIVNTANSLVSNTIDRGVAPMVINRNAYRIVEESVPYINQLINNNERNGGIMNRRFS